MNDISVIVITWSPAHQADYRLALLRQTLTSLRACTDPPYTLVVVDNGEEPQTQYLRTIQPDIHIVNRVNQGPGVARNQGALVTQSRYLAFIDNDVVFYPGWLKTSVDLLAQYPDRKFIVAPTRSGPMKNQRRNFIERWEDGHELWRVSGGYCLVMPRTAFEEIGLWTSSDLEPVEDREYAYRAQDKGYVYIWPPGGFVRHAGRYKSFNKHALLVGGQWIVPSKESNAT